MSTDFSYHQQMTSYEPNLETSYDGEDTRIFRKRNIDKDYLDVLQELQVNFSGSTYINLLKIANQYYLYKTSYYN